MTAPVTRWWRTFLLSRSALIPANVPDGEERSLAEILSSLIPIPAYEIESQILDGKRSIDPFLPIVLDRDAAAELAFTIEAQRSVLSGVTIEARF